jgi:trk system potassium uptake protein
MINWDRQKKIFQVLNIFLAFVELFSITVLIIIVGFSISREQLTILNNSIEFMIFFFVAQEIIRWAIARNKLKLFKERILETITGFVLALYLIIPSFMIGLIQLLFPFLTSENIAIVYAGIAIIPIAFLVIRKALKYNYLLGRLQLHPGAIFMISFALIILFGTMLLMLPKSAPVGKSVSFIDALFTSTSAVCVTGLSVIDTAKNFSMLGQVFIAMLIQIGGLGVMTLTTMFALFVSGGMSFQVRLMMSDILSENNLSDVSQMILRIILYTLTIEFIGAIFIYFSLGGSLIEPNFSFLFSAFFHAISAFCNAGFSIYSQNMMEPIVYSNYYVLSMIMFLIVAGGMGFTVMVNIANLKLFNRKVTRIRYQLTVGTKIVLITTALLIILPAVLIYFLNPVPYPISMNEFEKFFHSMFLSVTTRTAGFNSTPTGLLTSPVTLIAIILMAIGASPGSTGGGIKTSTFAIAFLAFINIIRGKSRLEVFKREISGEYIRKAFSIIFVYTMVLLTGSMIFMIIEPEKDPISVIFECTSALSTVGLSKNLTFFIGTGAKVILTIMMFIGRVGVLSFFLAFYSPAREPAYSLPKTDLMIG